MTQKRSLKVKFIVSMCVITLLVLAVTSAVTLVISMKISRDSTQTSMEQLVRMGHLQVESWFDDKEQLLDLIADDMALFTYGDKAAIENYLARYMQGEYPYITDIYVTTPDKDMYSGIYYVSDGTVDWHTRYWYYGAMEAGGLVYTKPYISMDAGNPTVITISKPVTDSNGTGMGVLAIDMELSSLIRFVNNERLMDTRGRGFLLDEDGYFITHANEGFLPQFAMDGTEVYHSFQEAGIDLGKTIHSDKVLLSKGRDWDGTSTYFATVTIPRNGWVYGFSVPSSDFNGGLVQLTWVWAVMIVAMIALSVGLSAVMSHRLLVPIHTIIRAAGDLALGDMDVDIDIQTGDELETLSSQFRRMIDGNSQQIEAMGRMAEGDFTVRIQPKSDKDALSITLNNVIHRLRGTVSEVNASIDMFATSATEISSAAVQLSTGCQEQTDAVEALSGSLNNILETTRENANNANSASLTIEAVREKAGRGSRSMASMVQAVEEMDASSADISRIVGVIDTISFQTNILALNAAVEAARAGHHGKGFAVVADEVRRLATHSATAAQEISQLIGASSQKASEGVEIAQQTQMMLEEIIDSIDSTAAAVQCIDGILDQQVRQIDGIAGNVSQITSVVQVNSATAEQTAAATQQMSAQAHILQQSMSVFRTGDRPPRPPEQGESGMALPDRRGQPVKQ